MENISFAPDPKTERLEARLTASQKALFQRAASLMGVSMTDFIVQAVTTEALRVIQTHELLSLTAQDSQLFAEALLNPPEPNQALHQAAARYKSVISLDPQ